LFCWLYAAPPRRAVRAAHRGNTDLERSTEAAIQQILDGMRWAGLDHDEGPFYQTKRFRSLTRKSSASCSRVVTPIAVYSTKEELAQLRADQMARAREAALRRPPGAIAPMCGRTCPRSSAQEPAARAGGRARCGARLSGVSKQRARRSDHCAFRRHRRPTIFAWWWTTWTCASPM